MSLSKMWTRLSTGKKRAVAVVIVAAIWAWFPTRDLIVATLLASVVLLPLSFVAAAWLWGIDRG